MGDYAGVAGGSYISNLHCKLRAVKGKMTPESIFTRREVCDGDRSQITGIYN
jgi:hypothetical protein